jgi:hypothetical protein
MGQRSGLAKTNGGFQMAGGGPVQTLAQVDVALDPTTALTTDTFIQDLFNYTILNTGGPLETLSSASSSKWQTWAAATSGDLGAALWPTGAYRSPQAALWGYNNSLDGVRAAGYAYNGGSLGNGYAFMSVLSSPLVVGTTFHASVGVNLGLVGSASTNLFAGLALGCPTTAPTGSNFVFVQVDSTGGLGLYKSVAGVDSSLTTTTIPWNGSALTGQSGIMRIGIYVTTTTLQMTLNNQLIGTAVAIPSGVTPGAGLAVGASLVNGGVGTAQVSRPTVTSRPVWDQEFFFAEGNQMGTTTAPKSWYKTSINIANTLALVDAINQSTNSTPATSPVAQVTNDGGFNWSVTTSAKEAAVSLYSPLPNLGTSYIVKGSVSNSSTDPSNVAGFFTGATATSALNALYVQLTGSGVVQLFQRTTLSGGAGNGVTTLLSSYAIPGYVAGTSYQIGMQLSGTTAGSLVGILFGGVFTGGTGLLVNNLGGTISGFGFLQYNQVSGSASNTYSVGGFQVTNSTAAIANSGASATVQAYTIAIAGGNLYYAVDSGTLALANGQGPLSVPPISTMITPSITTLNGIVYIADGNIVWTFNPVSNVFGPLVATVGEAPQNCTIAITWRGRLVLSGCRSDPQNFFMSRISVPTDFNYAAIDPAAAFAGNSSQAGLIGEPVTALMTFTDDIMLVGSTHNMWAIKGDPAAGGSIDLVSSSIGVLGQNAWCRSPQGIIYFLGTRGLFSIQAGGIPQNLTATTYDAYFQAIDSSANFMTLVFDHVHTGLYVFVTPTNDSTNPTHLWYDLRNGGLWPQVFPLNCGPTHAIMWNGNSPTNNKIRLGCWDGFVRQLGDSYLDDDGVAIVSSLTLGPFLPAGPIGDAVVTKVDFTTGEPQYGDSGSKFSMGWTLNGGKSAYEVTDGLPSRRFTSGVVGSLYGWQTTRRQRLRGGWFSLTISNGTIDTYWALEHIVLTVEGGGVQR